MKSKNKLGQKVLLHSKIAVSVFLLAGTLLTSCNKDDDEAIITEADAADIVEGTLAASSYGISEILGYASQTAEENEVYTETPTINCGQVYSKDTIFSATQTNYSYNYSVHQSYQITCTGEGYPQTFVYNHEMNGIYDATKMSSNDNAQSSIIITDLEPTKSTATVNGTYERNGTQQSKVRNHRSFSSTIDYNLTNLSIDKVQQKILGGTAILTISLSADGTTINYNANLTFLGNNSATLVINGNSYSLSW